MALTAYCRYREPPFSGPCLSFLLAAPIHSRKPVFLKHAQCSPNLRRGLVAVEMFPNIVSGHALGVVAEFPEHFIRRRISQSVTEDEPRGIFAVLPDG
jgi:hypothetical protein